MNEYGGSREGVLLMPKSLQYGAAFDAAEAAMAKALPIVIAKLIEMATAGNMAAIRYLCDRMLGKPAKAPVAPILDNSDQFSEEEYYDKKIKEFMESPGFDPEGALREIERLGIQQKEFQGTMRTRIVPEVGKVSPAASVEVEAVELSSTSPEPSVSKAETDTHEKAEPVEEVGEASDGYGYNSEAYKQRQIQLALRRKKQSHFRSGVGR